MSYLSKMESHSRYLQGPGPQHPGSLVLGHVDGGDPLGVRPAAAPSRQDRHVLPVLLHQARTGSSVH